MTIRNLFPKPTSPDWHKCVLGGSVIIAAVTAMIAILVVVLVATWASDTGPMLGEGLKERVERVWCGEDGCDWTRTNG